MPQFLFLLREKKCSTGASHVLAFMLAGLVVVFHHNALSEQIRLVDSSSVASVRTELIEFIWGDKGFPTEKVPDQVELDIVDSRYEYLRNADGNLREIDRYTVRMDNGFESVIYHFHPIVSNNRLFIYHSGHSPDGFIQEDEAINDYSGKGFVIPALLAEGYSVLGISMPLYGNNHPTIVLPGVGEFTFNLHDEMLTYLERPFVYFFEPIAETLNYVQQTYAYSDISMTGLSGGGWTTTVYSAIDKRISFSCPVAGTIPLPFRNEQDYGDGEQYHRQLYQIANYSELYVMGAYGKGRGQIQILNRYDDQVFWGTRHLFWVDSVKNALQRLGEGTYDFFLDETVRKHTVSPLTLSLILRGLHEGAPQEPILLSPGIRVLDFPCNAILDWQQSLGAETFRLQVAADSAFDHILFDDSSIKNTTSEMMVTLDPPGAERYWRVNASNCHGVSSWSAVSMHKVPKLPLAIAISRGNRADLDQTYSDHLIAYDPDDSSFGDAVRYRITRKPMWLAIDSLTGALAGTPQVANLGDTLLTVAAFDNIGVTDTAQFSIPIHHTNRVPVITGLLWDTTLIRDASTQVMAHEDTPFRAQTRAHDVDSTAFGDRLCYRLSLRPGWLTIDSTTGVLSGTPRLSDVGNTTIEIIVDDGKGGVTARPFAISVVHENHAPVLVRIPRVVFAEDSSAWLNLRSYATDSDGPVQSLTWNVWHDTTSDGRSLIVSLDTLSATVQFSAARNFFCSNIPVYVKATDPLGAFGCDTIHVTILQVNDPPVLAHVDTVKFPESDSLLLPYSTWYTAVHDPDNSTPSLAWSASSGKHVRVTKAASGLLFKADRYWNGSEALTLAVTDSAGLSDSTRLYVTVTPVNDPPVITSKADTFACFGARYSFHVAASDPDDSTLLYSMSGPAWLHVDSTGTVLGVPATVGEFPIVVRVSDPQGASDSLSYTLSVTVLKSVAGGEEGIPQDFIMQQNYPNPFNPSTTLHFGLPERSHVRVEIYNMIGQRIEQLLLGDLDAGYHNVTWQPQNTASGAYFIVLEGKGIVTQGRDVRLVKRALLLR